MKSHAQDELWAALVDLYDLLCVRENAETSYQAFFEKHPIVLTELGFDVAVPFIKGAHHRLPFDPERGFSPEPDFICAKRRTGEVTICELKTPFQSAAIVKRSDGNREKFSASLETHLAQASEYVESIQGREKAREVVREALALDNIGSYDILLIYGLHNQDEAPSIARLANGRKIATRILSYDELLNRLIASYTRTRGDEASQPGLCIACRLVVARSQPQDRAYLIDFGLGDRDRVSLFVESNFIVLDCIDSHGQHHTMRNPIAPSEPHSLIFQMSSDPNRIWISCLVDNDEVNLRHGREPLEIAPRFDSLRVGCNVDGLQNGKFLLGLLGVYGRTLAVSERIQLSAWLRGRSGKESWLEFDGTKSMLRDSAGNLIAPADESRPVRRDRITY